MTPFYDDNFYGFGDQTEVPPYLGVHQVHGTKVVDHSCADEKADGIFTFEAGVFVGVKTADCLPVLFHGPSVVGAVHAGWRGLAGGILSEARDFLLSHGVSLAQMTVMLGPAICGSCFEVGFEVFDQMKKIPLKGMSDQALTRVVTKKTESKIFISLIDIAKLHLEKLGFSPSQIFSAKRCTYCDHSFPSYRREGSKAGRLVSYIGL